MEDKKQKLLSLVREAAQPPKKRRAAPRKPAQSVRIDGSHNIVGDGNTIIQANTVRPRIIAPPPQGAITAEQAQTLRELLAEWKTVHDRIKRRPLPWPAAWERFKKKFRVNSYLHLPAERFEEAADWLRRQRATIDGMKSAPRKDPGWRSRAIRYVKARCKNQLGDEYAYLPYISRFGKTSLADLTDDELARTKAYISKKKDRLTGGRQGVSCRMQCEQTHSARKHALSH